MTVYLTDEFEFHTALENRIRASSISRNICNLFIP